MTVPNDPNVSVNSLILLVSTAFRVRCFQPLSHLSIPRLRRRNTMAARKGARASRQKAQNHTPPGPSRISPLDLAPVAIYETQRFVVAFRRGIFAFVSFV